MLHSTQTFHAWLGQYSVKYLQLCRPKGLQYCEQIQHFCRQRIYETSGTFCSSVYCQIYETFSWLRNKNRYMNDSDQKAASYTVRLECATLQFEELSRDLQIKSQTSLCFFAFQQKHYLKGHLMLREHVSLFFFPPPISVSQLCLLPTRVGNIFAFFSFTDYSTCGRVLCTS